MADENGVGGWPGATGVPAAGSIADHLAGEAHSRERRLRLLIVVALGSVLAATVLAPVADHHADAVADDAAADAVSALSTLGPGHTILDVTDGDLLERLTDAGVGFRTVSAAPGGIELLIEPSTGWAFWERRCVRAVLDHEGNAMADAAPC